MNIYEIVLILIRDFVYIRNFISSFTHHIIYNNFSILNTERWGVLNFRYKIKGYKKGFFTLFRFSSNKSFFLKILKRLKSDSSIIRFLSVNLKKNTFSLSFDFFKKILEYEKKNKIKSKKKF
ncbi:MAG: 30S ribosomal protein S6 [Candidatus Nasuia deltocephalinicola]